MGHEGGAMMVAATDVVVSYAHVDHYHTTCLKRDIEKSN